MSKALIVEDEPEANELLAMLVQLRGYETVSAFNGQEAIKLAGLDRPDLVFLDLMLPDLNGYEVCRLLKSSRKTSAIPIVIVTARLADENRIEGFRLGATEYVPKPYTPDQIFGAMAEADTWRSKLERAELHGIIRFDAGSEMTHLREISRLWSLLLDRTSISEDAARTFHRTLVELASRAGAWGLRSGVGRVASLDYRCDSSRLILNLRDESGWFSADSPLGLEGLGGVIDRGHFDEVVYNPRHAHVSLTRLFLPHS